jgi:hypothetical protein
MGRRAREAGPSCFILAEAGANWIVSVTLGSGVFAGNVHELAVTLVQEAGAMAAVAPEGIPLTVNRIGVGNSAPVLGMMFSG